ncbi:hypothetical protein AVEN_216746-1 [Araneus ventricosus]|uniref:Ig-like domain-containing protein n=1 Tax=Araneus ventricosus TaxID=182803 RepID=A0A4Y2L956_ARAVE|nr:hypothetical protein AVEN_216746-1 [Araneus ventricosus]
MGVIVAQKDDNGKGHPVLCLSKKFSETEKKCSTTERCAAIIFAVKKLQYIPVIVAVAGNKAVIPCNVTAPLQEDGASMILWYRLDNPDPIYTLDIRKTAIKSAQHFPSPEIQDRIHFDVSVHPPVLIISSVVPEDAEIYKCRVDLRRSRTLLLQSRLKVIVPPHEPIIMDEYGQRLRGVIGPFDEGSTLTFICDVDGGNPHPSVTWWRGETLLDDVFNVTTKGFVRNKLTLNKIRRSDLMAQHSCKASNTNLTKPKVESIQLDMNRKSHFFCKSSDMFPVF